MKIDSAWAISDRTRASLARCELFQDLKAGQLMEIAAHIEECSLQPDELLVREGDTARYLFVVVEGRAVAQMEMYAGWMSLGTIGPSDAAGWSSLVGAPVYPASVKAVTPIQAARIDTRGLALLMSRDPSIGYLINRRLSLIFCRQYHAALEALKTVE